MFVHVVLFFLKPDAPADAAERLKTDCLTLLSSIPVVRKCDAGYPVASPRPVVDGSYQVGLMTIFDDKAGHDVYQNHPLHLQFIERNKANWDRVVVYDFA